MKISKRILGVAIALIMVFNVFAIGAFAAFPDDTAVKLGVSTDKTTYAPGETIVLTISQQVLEEIGQMRVSGCYVLSFDGSAIAPISDDFSAVSAQNLVIADAISGGYDDAASAVLELTPDENGAAIYGWTRTLGYMLGELAGSEVPFDCFDAPYEMFTIEMKVSETAAEGTYTIGFDPTAYENCDGYSADHAMGGLYGTIASDYGYSVENMYEFGTCEITVATAAAEPEVVALDDTMARMDDWTKAESTNTFDGGLIGQINNLELTFTQEGDRLQCDQIESIEVYANGNKMGNAYQVYKVNDTTYQFRAVITNMDKTADTYATDVEYEFRVTLKGDYADTTLTATKTVSAKAIYEEAYAAYQLANP